MSFPAYDSYRDSGVEWLGDVPESWDVVPLKAGYVVAGGATPKSDVEAYWDGGIPWITPGDLSGLKTLEIGQTARTISEEGLSSCSASLVPAGSFVLSTRAPIGSLGIATRPATTNQGCKSLVPRSGSVSRYLAYVLSSATEALNVRGRGTTFLELSGDELARFKVPAPSASEQRAIAAFLDRETAKIDALVKAQRRLIELLKEKRQAVISHAVTKGLDPTVPMKDSGVEWLGEVPAHWEVERLASWFREVSEQGDDSLPILSVSIHDGVSDEEPDPEHSERKVTRSDDRTKYKRVQPNDLVYNMMRAWQGGFGTVQVPGAVSPAYVVARPTRPQITRFVELLLRTPKAVEEMRRRSRGITDFRLRLYWDEFKDIRVAIPSDAEVDGLIDQVSGLSAFWDSLSSEADAAITLLLERRAALISAAVTGKIDVRGLVNEQAEAA